MKQKMKTKIKKYIAESGKLFPIFYKGSIIHIGDKVAIEIDENSLMYEPKLQFQEALKLKQITEAGE